MCPFLPVLPCSVKKVNKLLHNILVTSCPKQPKTKLQKWDEKLNHPKIPYKNIVQKDMNNFKTNLLKNDQMEH